MLSQLSSQVDRLFPAHLAIGTSPEFYEFAVDFTTIQLRISLWLAVFTLAIFGIWDVFGGDGAVFITRFRFLVGCPIFAVFALAGNSEFQRLHRDGFLIAFSSAAIVLVSVTIILIDKELPFKISSGNATINFYLVIFFGFALLPFFVLNGIVFGTLAIFAHASLLYFFSTAGLVVNSFYVFHTMNAVLIGMFVAYWRERFIRGDFVSKREISDIRSRISRRQTKIVISYRCADTDAIAGRIRDKLANYFGESSIFMDIDSIAFGVDFRREILKALSNTNLLIVVMGQKWVGAARGLHRKIMDEADPVRIEVEIALQGKVPIIPVLVQGSKMPKEGELPASLHELCYKNAATVDAGRDFHQHMERLIRSIERILNEVKIIPTTIDQH